MEISLADIFPHEFKKLGWGLIADFAFGLDHSGAALAALRRITDRYERKRHIVGMRRRQRHSQPKKSENARANIAKRFQTPESTKKLLPVCSVMIRPCALSGADDAA